MKLRAMLVLTSLLVVGAIAAGCGSSGNDTTSTSSITKAEFIAKADAICQQGNQEINKAGQQQFQGQGKPTQAQFNQFATQTIIPGVQKQVDQIKALGAPSGDEAQVNQILTTVQADIDKVKADPSLVQGNAFADGNKLAQDYGLKVCGKG